MDLARGKANTPLEAAARLQEVSETAGELAERADGATAEALKQASQSAAKSAWVLCTGAGGPDPCPNATARHGADGFAPAGPVVLSNIAPELIEIEIISVNC